MKANPDTESAALASLEELNEAFASQDVERALKLFASDPDVIFFASEASETAFGKNELKRVLTQLFSRSETYSWRWGRVTVSSVNSVAWVVTDSLIEVHRDSNTQEYPYRLTIILEKRNDKWLLLHFHGSEPADQES